MIRISSDAKMYIFRGNIYIDVLDFKQNTKILAFENKLTTKV